MARLFACLHRAGEPPPGTELEQIFGGGKLIAGTAVIDREKGHITYRLTSLFPGDPGSIAVFEDHGLVLLLAGRFDHRERVAASLGLKAADYDDACLALHAYLRWGDEWTDHVFGTVAAIIMDTARGRLLACRDELGRVPMYYFSKGTTLLLASAPDVLLRHPSVDAERDQMWVSGFFAGMRLPVDRSAFAAIKPLLPGQRLIWTARDGVQLRLGRFRLGRQSFRFRHDAEYGEAFRERLAAAIADRTKGMQRLGIMLSGGMDSCPVACLAADIFRETGQTLSAYYWTLEQFPEANEAQEIMACAAFAGLPSRYFRADKPLPFSDPLDNGPEDFNSPITNAFWRLICGIYRLAAADGCQILLNGGFGDRIYPKDWQLADAIADGELRLAAEEFWYMVGKVGWRGLWRSRQSRNYIKRFLGIRRTPIPRAPAWLTPWAAARLPGPPDRPRVVHPRPDHYQALAGTGVFELQVGHRVDDSRFGVNMLDPFHDWDLIDFMLGIPAYQTCRLGQTKWLAREGMRDRMPEALRTRPRGGVLSSFYVAGFNDAKVRIRTYLSSPDCTWPDYVKPEVLLPALNEATTQEPMMLLAQKALGYELWNRRVNELVRLKA